MTFAFCFLVGGLLGIGSFLAGSYVYYRGRQIQIHEEKQSIFDEMEKNGCDLDK